MGEDESVKYICPRRYDSLGEPRAGDVASDTWHMNSIEHPDSTGAGQRACSYCGSMHPDDLFEAITRGDEIGPTDKDYKIYVGHGPGHKFYFQHLDYAQKLRFIDLLNDHKIEIGYPGHFYIKPFFIARNR